MITDIALREGAYQLSLVFERHDFVTRRSGLLFGILLILTSIGNSVHETLADIVLLAHPVLPIGLLQLCILTKLLLPHVVFTLGRSELLGRL